MNGQGQIKFFNQREHRAHGEIQNLRVFSVLSVFSVVQDFELGSVYG
jgi:hypothetical protein